MTLFNDQNTMHPFEINTQKTTKNMAETAAETHPQDEVNRKSQIESTIIPTCFPPGLSFIAYLETIPYEMRDEIYQNLSINPLKDISTSSRQNCPYFGATIRKTTSDFIHFLCPLPLAYDHALQFFSRDGIVVLDGRPQPGRQGHTGYHLHALPLTDRELSAVGRVHVILQYGMVRYTGEGLKTKDHSRPTWFTKQFLRYPNIRDVYVSMNLDSVDGDELFCLMTEFAFWFQGCKKLSRATVELSLIFVLDDRARYMFHERFRVVNKQVGVKGIVQVGDVDPLDPYKQSVLVIWQAQKGEYMDWSGHMGKEYMFPKKDKERPGQFMEDRVHAVLGMDDGGFFLDGWDDRPSR